jgi:ATP-binding cassette subfamily F protein uup
VAEINPAYAQGAFQVEGNYSKFLERRQEFFEAESKQQESLATKVRREVEWLRRGPKARTGKSRARIDAAGRLIDQLSAVTARGVSSTAQIDFTASDRKTKRLIETEGIGKAFGEKMLFRNLNLTLSPGVRFGLVGSNGSGKTTLLKILQGEIEPDQGAIRRADALRLVSFAQDRTSSLDPQATLRRTLSPAGDAVIYQGRSIHVAGWAKRFLFREEQLEMPMSRLSGGEKARVLIARLMLEPADVLFLDEPTNDLDIPTLEVLEESLLEFPGALVLVSHDRYLLDRVSTVVLGLNGEGDASLFADYSQWEASRNGRSAEKPVAKQRAPRETAPGSKKKLSYIEQREWDGMEQLILQSEQEMAACERAVEQSASDAERLPEAYAKLQEAQARVEQLYARWADLEEKAVG